MTSDYSEHLRSFSVKRKTFEVQEKISFASQQRKAKQKHEPKYFDVVVVVVASCYYYLQSRL